MAIPEVILNPPLDKANSLEMVYAWPKVIAAFSIDQRSPVVRMPETTMLTGTNEM